MFDGPGRFSRGQWKLDAVPMKLPAFQATASERRILPLAFGNRGAMRFKSSTRRFGNGVRHGEVVQLAKRLWLYSTYRRRQRCIRAHLGCRASRPELAQ